LALRCNNSTMHNYQYKKKSIVLHAFQMTNLDGLVTRAKAEKFPGGEEQRKKDRKIAKKTEK